MAWNIKTEQSIAIKTKALGRPFQLGMLYDCRNDQLVPGVTLWNKSDLDNDVSVHLQPLTEYSLETSNSLTDKFNALDINTSLRGSFSCGLIEAEGSAKYLNNSNMSKYQARVTLNYLMTTVFKQLTMNQLSRNNITYEEVFRQGTATHVVTAILYGARALLVFDRGISKDESAETIAAHLKLCVDKITQLTIEGKGSLDLSDKEKKEAERIHCTFHGDFCIPNLPVDYLTALEVYKTLPTSLGKNGEYAVPITVWLHPLSLLEPTAAKLKNQVSTDIVTQVVFVLDSLLEAAVMCNDFLINSTVKRFYSIEKKIVKFKLLLENYKLHFQKNLAEILPSVRSGTAGEDALVHILKTHGMSPFSEAHLQDWLYSLQKEIKVIEVLIKGMEENNVSLLTAKTDTIVDLLLELNHDYVVSFNFNLLSNESRSLKTMENYLKSGGLKGIVTDMESKAENGDEWIYSQMNFNKMRLAKQLFADFASSNQHNKATKLVVTANPLEKQECISILLYYKGELCNLDVELPSIPKTPKLQKISGVSAEIELCLPIHGPKGTVKYLVQVRKSGEEEWRSEMTGDTEKCFILKDLQESTQYDVRYAAVCEAGVGPPSDIICICTEDSGSVSCICGPQQELDLTDANLTPEYMKALMLILHSSRSIRMFMDAFTPECCEVISSVLSNKYSELTELELMHGELKDSGVHLLCKGLSSTNCKLEKLRLIKCQLTFKSCAALASVLSAEHSHLTELDLSENHFYDPGVCLLCKGMMNKTCKLEKLRLVYCQLTFRCCAALASVLSFEHSHLTDLDLEDNGLGDSGVLQLCEMLKNKNCKLEKLSFFLCHLTSQCCAALSLVLSTEHSHLTELKLGWNKLEDSGVNLLCVGLRKKNCKLQKLDLWSCSLTSGCCDALSSVLSTEHSRLTELELSNNKLEDSGVHLLCRGLKNKHCKLQKLGVKETGISEGEKSNLKSLEDELNRSVRCVKIDIGDDQN